MGLKQGGCLKPTWVKVTSSVKSDLINNENWLMNRKYNFLLFFLKRISLVSYSRHFFWDVTRHTTILKNWFIYFVEGLPNFKVRAGQEKILILVVEYKIMINLKC